MSRLADQQLHHLHRNLTALLWGMGVTVTELARRAGIGRRAIAYKFNPLRDPQVRGTSLHSLVRVAAGAGCSMLYLHLTPQDAEDMLGRRYTADSDLKEVEPDRAAMRVVSHLKDHEVAIGIRPQAAVLGVALESRQAALDWARRLTGLQRH